MSALSVTKPAIYIIHIDEIQIQLFKVSGTTQDHHGLVHHFQRKPWSATGPNASEITYAQSEKSHVLEAFQHLIVSP